MCVPGPLSGLFPEPEAAGAHINSCLAAHKEHLWSHTFCFNLPQLQQEVAGRLISPSSKQMACLELGGQGSHTNAAEVFLADAEGRVLYASGRTVRHQPLNQS